MFAQHGVVLSHRDGLCSRICPGLWKCYPSRLYLGRTQMQCVATAWQLHRDTDNCLRNRSKDFLPNGCLGKEQVYLAIEARIGHLRAAAMVLRRQLRWNQTSVLSLD